MYVGVFYIGELMNTNGHAIKEYLDGSMRQGNTVICSNISESLPSSLVQVEGVYF